MSVYSPGTFRDADRSLAGDGARCCRAGDTLASIFAAYITLVCCMILIIGFFYGAFQPHLDQMQHAPINEVRTARVISLQLDEPIDESEADPEECTGLDFST
jgi:hypothetical protein